MPSDIGMMAEKNVMRAPFRYNGTDGPGTLVIVQLADGACRDPNTRASPRSVPTVGMGGDDGRRHRAGRGADDDAKRVGRLRQQLGKPLEDTGLIRRARTASGQNQTGNLRT